MTATQYDLFGGEQVAGDVVDRLTDLLESYPDARECYMVAIFRYWLTFEGLDQFVADPDALLAWAQRATPAQTLRNRHQDVWKELRRDLAPTQETQARWWAMRKQGPIA